MIGFETEERLYGKDLPLDEMINIIMYFSYFEDYINEYHCSNLLNGLERTFKNLRRIRNTHRGGLQARTITFGRLLNILGLAPSSLVGHTDQDYHYLSKKGQANH